MKQNGDSLVKSAIFFTLKITQKNRLNKLFFLFFISASKENLVLPFIKKINNDGNIKH